MPRSTYYVQECPTCGRNLQVRVEYLGRLIVCQHCSARFEACQSGEESSSHVLSGAALMQRAEELITASESQISRSREFAAQPK
ncbi:MAG: hypothetical protein WD851_08450 [Pirellulales bacterium]